MEHPIFVILNETIDINFFQRKNNKNSKYLNIILNTLELSLVDFMDKMILYIINSSEKLMNNELYDLYKVI